MAHWRIEISGIARARYVAVLFAVFAGAGGYWNHQIDKEESARDQSREAMDRRIEALESRLLNCGH